MTGSARRCTICENKISVPIKAWVDGMILDICDDCLKYGKRIEITDVDRILDHCCLIESIWIE